MQPQSAQHDGRATAGAARTRLPLPSKESSSPTIVPTGGIPHRRGTHTRAAKTKSGAARNKGEVADATSHAAQPAQREEGRTHTSRAKLRRPFDIVSRLRCRTSKLECRYPHQMHSPVSHRPNLLWRTSVAGTTVKLEVVRLVRLSTLLMSTLLHSAARTVCHVHVQCQYRPIRFAT